MAMRRGKGKCRYKRKRGKGRGMWKRGEGGNKAQGKD